MTPTEPPHAAATPPQPKDKMAQIWAASILNTFHDFYFNGLFGSAPWRRTQYMGLPIYKCPLDLWVYQEIIFETRPDLIVETGTFMGASALYLAHLFDALGHGRVVTIDTQASAQPAHPRIRYVAGSSASPAVIDDALEGRKNAERVMVILDSDHTEAHVTKELALLANEVSVGCYLIVEDGNINGHPVLPDFGPGPYEAVQKFLAANPNFEVDPAREKFLLTFSPDGFLKRTS